MADNTEKNGEDEKTNDTLTEKSDHQTDDKLVTTAIQFLQNPKVTARPLDQKKQFLKMKGLTDKQIDEAVKLSGSLDQFQYQPNLPPRPPMYLQPAPLSVWMRVRDTSFVIVVLCGAGYGIYKLYLNYVKPYLFETKEESETDKTLKLLIETMQNVQQTLNSTQEKLKELVAIAQSNQNMQKFKEMEYFQELKAEVNSIKGLLLNRRSFPPPPNLINGLPSWQTQHTAEANNDSMLTDQLKDESVEKLQDNSSQSI